MQESALGRPVRQSWRWHKITHTDAGCNFIQFILIPYRNNTSGRAATSRGVLWKPLGIADCAHSTCAPRWLRGDLSQTRPRDNSFKHIFFFFKSLPEHHSVAPSWFFQRAKRTVQFFLFCFVFSRHRPPPRLPREEQSRPPALPTSFHLKKNMDARTYILSLFHLGSSTGQWHCFNITAKNVIPRRRGESGCSGALGQQAWDRVWMVEIRTKELLPFFFLLFFFYTSLFVLCQAGSERPFRA